MNRLDKLAVAALGAFHDSVNAAHMLAEWESMSPTDRATWRSVADAVLMANDLLAPDGHVVLPLNADDGSGV